jgi:Fe-S cluster assembly protein SufD
LPKETLEKQKINFEEGVIRTAMASGLGKSKIKDLKQNALDFISNNSFPTNKNEDWKYYDFKDLFFNSSNIFSKTETFKKDELATNELIQLVDKYVFRESAENLIVTVNGVYREDLSNFTNRDIEVSNLNNHGAKTLKEKEPNNLGDQYLRSLNTLLIDNAFFIKVAKSKKIAQPLQVLHISNQNSFNIVRSVIEVEDFASLDIIVSYVGLEESNYITNAIIDCHLGKNANLNFDKIQSDSKNAVTLYNLNAKLARDANFTFNSLHYGAKSSRDEIIVDLNGTNANTDLNGLYVINGNRKTHQKITVNHNSEHCTSSQLFKGIITDAARAEFNGLIDVKREAQKTDAKQLNNNLLLSQDAHVDSRPQLNILADDVKCAHGSTVGQLDEEELFYLQSRGLSKEDAYTTLTYSFCEEILQKLKHESVKNYTTNLAFNNLSATTNSTLANLADNDKFKKSRYSK